jgi:O-antigen/teichoic acid export membrane protein
LSLRKRLVADGLYTFTLRIVNMAASAALGILTARVLGPHGRGIYALPMVDTALVSASYSGLSLATSYFMLRRNAGRGVVRVSLLAMILFIVVGAMASVVVAALTHNLWSCVPAMLALPGPAALTVVYGYAVGTHRVRINTSLALVSTVLMALFMVAAFAIAGGTPATSITAWVVSSDVLAVAILIWMFRDSRKLAYEGVRLREYVTYALRTGAVNVVALLNYRADVYIVAIFGGPTLLGMYTLAVAAAETLLTATQVTSVVTSPLVGSMDQEAAAELTARCVRHNVIVASVCCGALSIAAPFVVHLLYGAAFLPMVPALRVLLLGVFALSLGSPMSTFFTLRLGKPEVSLILASISATICIVVSVLLVPRMGLIGAAIGSTLAYILGQSAAIAYFGMISGISASRMLIPRFRDLVVYGEILIGLTRRLRRT